MQRKDFSIEVDGKEFRYWTSLSIVRAIDSVDTITLSAPFDRDRLEMRDLFRPAQFRDIVVLYRGSPIFTGTMLNPVASLDAESTTVEVSAYSRCGVLEDCTMPSSSLPLEFTNVKLDVIAKIICEPFGLTPVFEGDVGAVFDSVAIKPTEQPLNFLAGLAKQRNFVIGATASGDPLFWRSTDDLSVVESLTEGLPPIISFEATVNDRAIFSEVTALAKVKKGFGGSVFTEHNPLPNGRLRPSMFELDDTEAADVPEAVKARKGRMFGEAVSYTAQLATTDDSKGNLWDRNKHVDVFAPRAMIYSPTKLLIRSVTIDVTAASRTVKLDLVLPGVFSGEPPERMPWDETA